jgi:hypothetical protein
MGVVRGVSPDGYRTSRRRRAGRKVGGLVLACARGDCVVNTDERCEQACGTGKQQETFHETFASLFRLFAMLIMSWPFTMVRLA